MRIPFGVRMTSSKERHDCQVAGCKQSFPTARGLGSHMKKHKARIECPICHELVPYLGPHLRRDHEDDDLVALERALEAAVAELRRWRAKAAEAQ